MADTLVFEGRERIMSFKQVTFKPRPHSTSRASLQQESQIYRQGKTPFYDHRKQLRILDVKPADATTAGQHLGEIGRHFGTRGLERSIRGLSLTRGEPFRQEALRSAPK